MYMCRLQLIVHKDEYTKHMTLLGVVNNTVHCSHGDKTEITFLMWLVLHPNVPTTNGCPPPMGATWLAEQHIHSNI